MLDLKLVGGDVVDGTGAARVRSDVGVRDARIVSIGPTDEPASHTIDVTGLVVAPGFIDTHTHHDADVFWDPSMSPSPLHGVTTVIGGNCGFSIAPLSTDSADYVMRMLARVEGMPLAALEAGLDWDWSSFASWLARLDGNVAVNAGFLVGHSTLRRLAMGKGAVGDEASPAQIAAMAALLHEALEQGALGLSSSTAPSHNDGNGEPVPSRFASDGEHLALADVLAAHPATIIGFNPGASPFDGVRDLMAEMSRRSTRVLNWNALLVDSDRAEAVEHELAVSDYAAARGGRVLAQTVLDPRKFYLSFLNGFLLDVLPDWPWLFGLPLAERRAALRDPAVRARLRAGAASPEVPYVVQRYTRWSDLILVATSGSRRSWQGRTFGEIAAAEAVDPLDLLLDMAVDDNLGTVFMPTPLGDDADSWHLRSRVWQDRRTVIGASDAGAHLDVASSFDYSTSLLGPSVRDRGLLSLEQAVYELTGAQRRVCGVRDRGRIAPGWFADLVVFDPERIAPGPVETRDDLPSGARRLFAPASGIASVIVNGVEVARDGALTGALPGAVLRAGRDTTEPDD